MAERPLAKLSRNCQNVRIFFNARATQGVTYSTCICSVASRIHHKCMDMACAGSDFPTVRYIALLFQVNAFSYRIISNISTVLYFFDVPPPRAIIGDGPLLETVPLLFQPHFRGLLLCQIHV